MRTRKLLFQWLPAQIAVVLCSILLAGWFSARLIVTASNERLESEVRTLAETARLLIEARAPTEQVKTLRPELRQLGARISSRITVLNPEGVIIADSFDEPERLPSVLRRPEVQTAREGEVGAATRHSHVTDKIMMYVALPLRTEGRPHAVVRVGRPVMDLWSVAFDHRFLVIPTGLGLLAAAGLLSFTMSRGLNQQVRALRHGAARFAQGDLEYRLDIRESEEFHSLAESMNIMASQLNERVRIITRQRNELETILASMAEAVIVIDNEEHVVGVNRSAEILFEISQERVKGRTLQEAVRNNDLRRFVKEALASSDAAMETDVVLSGDADRFLQAHAAPLKDAAGRNMGILIVLNDVTRLKTLENIRKDFVANVSHELKTPITAIKGFLETLKEGAIDDPENARRFLDIILKHTDRLASIIEDLLSLSRIEREEEHGEIKLEKRPVREIIDAAVKTCAAKAELRDIVLKTEAPPELTVNCNPLLLEQALVNLIDNAVKYSEKGQPVKIEARREDGNVSISVIDQGCGIPRDHQTRIFERFYRVDKARSRMVGGTGLGLSIVKHIVNAHGGVVWVKSAPNKGSAFTFVLPTGENAGRLTAKQG